MKQLLLSLTLLIASLTPSLAGEPYGVGDTPESIFGRNAISHAITTAHFNTMWDAVRPVIHATARLIAYCEEGKWRPCPSEESGLGNAYRRYEEAKRDVETMATSLRRAGGIHSTLYAVNKVMNHVLKPQSDYETYGVPDRWVGPFDSFKHMAGDCEDYALAKYTTLLLMGYRDEDMRLMIVNYPDESSVTYHAVLAVREEGRWLVLDNIRDAILTPDGTGYKGIVSLRMEDKDRMVGALR